MILDIIYSGFEDSIFQRYKKSSVEMLVKKINDSERWDTFELSALIIKCGNTKLLRDLITANQDIDMFDLIDLAISSAKEKGYIIYPN